MFIIYLIHCYTMLIAQVCIEVCDYEFFQR